MTARRAPFAGRGARPGLVAHLGRVVLACGALACGALVGLAGGPAGCGGSSPPQVTDPADPQGSGAGSAAAEDKHRPDGPPGPPGAPLDDAECTQLADHIVDISMAGRRPPPVVGGDASAEYSAEDAESTKRELRQSLRSVCAQIPRRDFRCAMAARTTAELGACQK